MDKENGVIEAVANGEIKKEEEEKGQEAIARVDWKAKLHKSELVRDENSDRDYVVLAGLTRLAHEKGIKRTRTKVLQVPDPDNGENATVIYEIEFTDGTVFSAVGHANPDNCTDVYKKFVMCMAESRAKARAIRDALNIPLVSDEERNVEIDNKMPISDTQISLIKITLGRRGLKLEELLQKASRKVSKLEELTKSEGTSLIHFLNKQADTGGK